MYLEYKCLTIGSGGDGPAIYLDAELNKGSTHKCDTFQNPMLVLGGNKFEDDSFEASNVEVYAL